MFSSIPVYRASPTYNLFISHAWKYSAEYETIVGFLNADTSFKWKNLSVPQHDPSPRLTQLPRSLRSLLHELEDRISKADCVVILSGMYCAHSEWIQSEIEAAVALGKPIIGVKPRGQERLPEAVQVAAREMVGWNSSSIISSIRQHSVIPSTRATLAALAASPEFPTLPPPTPLQPPSAFMASGLGALLASGPSPTLPRLAPPAAAPLQPPSAFVATLPLRMLGRLGDSLTSPAASPLAEPPSQYRSLLGLAATRDEKAKASLFSAALGFPYFDK